MARQRLTWTEQRKKASPPPQMPAIDRTEAPDHPAYLPDPEANDYQNGDTSSWAEDPHPGPYLQSAPPAMPGNDTTEDVSHPAAVRKAAEKKAAMCVRIVQASNPGASVAVIEKKAMALMDRPDSQIRAAAELLALTAGDDEDEDDEEVEEEEEVEVASKKARAARAAAQARKAKKAEDEDEEEVEIEEEVSASKKARRMLAMLLKAAEEEEMSEEEKEEDEEVTSSKKASNLRKHFAKKAEDEDQDEASDEDDDEKMSSKTARKLQAMDRKLSKLVKAFGDFFGMDGLDGEDELDMMLEDVDMGDADLMATLENMSEDMDGDGIDQSDNSYGYMAGMDDMDEDAMLAALMAEIDQADMVVASDAELAVEPLAKGPGIQSGEGGNVDPEPAPVTPEVEQADTENNISMTAGEDPMGLMDEAFSSNEELMALYADLNLPKTAGDDDDEDDDDEDEEVEEEEEVEVASKKASSKKAPSGQRPQPKKASTGPKTLGAVPAPQSKKAKNEIDELSQIWDQAPDVSDAFGMPKRG